MKTIIFAAILLLLLVPAVSAQKNHLKLLAVSEQPDGTFTGAVADLFVEIRPGTGRVFMDTFPLSKLDTQISTRFAKEIACEVSTKDCSQLDFFYTIRSTSVVITGPSAGAALATLTIATLEDLPVNDKVSITGTMNSGGLIGPVSGVKEKIQAGAQVGLDTILIPYGEGFGESNDSINLTEFGNKLKVRVIEVLELEDAVYYVTGKRLPTPPTNFSIDPDYTQKMSSVAQSLCNRAENLAVHAASIVKNRTALQAISNLSNHGKSAYGQKQYYAAASFCFGASVRYNTLILQSSNLSDDEIVRQIAILKVQVQQKKTQIPSYSTITDLETYALVLERIIESEQSLNESLRELAQDDRNSALRDLAFARERLLSADSWSVFFGSDGKKVTISKEGLENACVNKIAEAEERLQYVQLFIPNSLQATRAGLNRAYSNLREKRFDICLFTASRAKAEADSVLSALGISYAKLGSVLDQKQKSVKIAIAKQAAKGNFPIAGYSYYEYANSLREVDPASALLFYEYALELSDLDIYFKEESKIPIAANPKRAISSSALILFVGGVALGLALGLLIRPRKKGLATHKHAYRHARKR